MEDSVKHPEDLATVWAGIEETNARFMEAFNQGDAAAATALYTEDAILFPPGHDMVRGLQAIQEFLAAYIETNVLSGLVLTSSDVQAGGNLAVGAVNVQGLTSGYEGKALVVWKKQEDGSWKLYRDMWSSNLMPAD